MGRSKDTRAISRDIVRTEASPRSRSRRSPAAHHAPCSPLGSPRTMKSREHKLDICFDFTRGSCRRGDGCRFSHNLPPGGVIPPRPKTAGVCFDYTKGICNRGGVSRRSRRPRRDLRRDLARPVKNARETPADQKARTQKLTIDACSFSRRVRHATRLPLSFLPPPLTITRPTPQGRVPFLARRAGGRGVRETRGERREPDFVQGAAEAASGPGGEAGGLFGKRLARRPPADSFKERALSRDRALSRETRETRRTSREREREREHAS